MPSNSAFEALFIWCSLVDYPLWSPATGPSVKHLPHRWLRDAEIMLTKALGEAQPVNFCGKIACVRCITGSCWLTCLCGGQSSLTRVCVPVFLTSPSGILAQERKLCRDLVHSNKKEQEFRSIFHHIQSAQSQRSPSELFAQHIVTIVHHVKGELPHARLGDCVARLVVRPVPEQHCCYWSVEGGVTWWTHGKASCSSLKGSSFSRNFGIVTSARLAVAKDFPDKSRRSKNIYIKGSWNSRLALPHPDIFAFATCTGDGGAIAAGTYWLEGIETKTHCQRASILVAYLLWGGLYAGLQLHLNGMCSGIPKSWLMTLSDMNPDYSWRGQFVG